MRTRVARPSLLRDAVIACMAITTVALSATPRSLIAQTNTQQTSALSVSADPRDHHALVRIGPVLDSRELRDAALAGLPVRVRVRTELWKDGFFDSHEESTDWSAVLVYEPLHERYLVQPIGATGPARSFQTYDLARAAIEGDLPIRLRPTGRGRFYYTATLEIETLSVSDLQELERWLQGELQPAVAGEHSIPGAIGAGAKRLLIRVLGVPGRRVEARSTQFRVGATGND